MPLPPPPLLDPTQLYLGTFAIAGMIADDPSPSVAAANLTSLNAAIQWSSDHRLPIIGLPGTYSIAPSGGGTTLIRMKSYAQVICLPGCILQHSFNGQDSGVLRFAGVHDASWVGGEIRGVPDGLGHFPYNAVIKITASGPSGGNRSYHIVIRDIVIDGWSGYSAIGIDGDFVTLINPTIKNPDLSNTNGIRMAGGTGFRCYGGSVDTGGDAALQFAAGPERDSITDGAYIGTRASSQAGRVLLVGSS